MLEYLNKIQLPNAPISKCGTVSHEFIKTGISTLWEAIAYVKQLPYGRNADRSQYLQVLTEQQGTCSTKHALIAALADELSLPLSLNLGIFYLTASNYPELAAILSDYQLPAIPEAHCFLNYKQHSLDLTFPEHSDYSIETQLEQIISITPEQIGSFKLEYHHSFINNWLANKPHLTFDIMWQAREQCISHLSQPQRCID